MDLPYSMIIRWSDADGVYIAHLPEFGDGASTHGGTYEEAARAGREVLEMVVADAIRRGVPLPTPQKYPDEPLPESKARSPKRPKRELQKQD